LFSALSPRAQGYALALAAPLCWSVGGAVMRLVDADSWDIVFWRGLPHLLIFPIVLYFLAGPRAWLAFRSAKRIAWLSSLCLASTFVLHVVAMTSTTIANALLLQSTTPIMVALLAWLVLRERVPAASWIALAGACAGMVVVIGATLGEGAWIGNAAALAVAFASAINVIAIRGNTNVDLRAGTVVASAVSIVPALIFGAPLSASFDAALALSILGIVQITVGLVFFYSALKRLPAVQVVLITMIEPVIGTFWTWLAVGEVPGSGTVLGGAILLASLAYNAIATARRRAP
jgi:drug/metabolite transporter (DMT)-like permease